MLRLDRKVIAVTGGASGIGEAIVRLFANEGAVVEFCSRGRQQGAAVESSVEESGGTAMYTCCDVTDEIAVEAWFNDIIQRRGRLDGLVNNAGITTSGPVEEMPLVKWDEILNINVTGMFLTTRSAIPLLRAASGGSIVNLGSTFGIVGAPNSVAYGITKAAAISFSKSLALELAPDGIRVNALCPGGTETPFTEQWLNAAEDPVALRASLESSHPIGRLATTAEQADAALFLISEQSSFVTGHALVVDGGYTSR
ncbi:MAG: SDR family NAD(P)-dependent oxidoreductase [Actinomycetota bacterium]